MRLWSPIKLADLPLPGREGIKGRGLLEVKGEEKESANNLRS